MLRYRSCSWCACVLSHKSVYRNVAAPAILCGIYKKKGVFLEKQVKFMREYFTRPRKRYYRTTNVFMCIERHIEYNRIKKKLADAERKG